MAKCWKIVKRYDRCFLCLGTGHCAEDCVEEGDWRHENCVGSHHQLLHQQPKPGRQLVEAGAVSYSHSQHNRSVLLPVQSLYMQDGSKINVLFDSGSQVTLVTQELVDRLSFDHARKSNIQVVGIGEGVSQLDYVGMVHVDTTHSVKQLNIEVCSPEWRKVVGLFPLIDPVNSVNKLITTHSKIFTPHYYC